MKGRNSSSARVGRVGEAAALSSSRSGRNFGVRNNKKMFKKYID